MAKQTLNDNFKLIDGTQAVEINKVCKEFKLLADEIERKTQRLNELKDTLKGLNEDSMESNTYETLDFIIQLTGRKGAKKIDNKILSTLYPDVINDERIYSTGKPSLAVTKVERKI